MEQELDERILKEVRKNYFSIVIKLIGLLVLSLFLIMLSAYFIFTYNLNIDYWMIYVIIIILVIIIFLYLVVKESNKPYVPIDFFMMGNEEILIDSLGGRLNNDRVGSGFCYLTTKRFIYLPTNHARTKKGTNPLFLPLRNIRSISKSSHDGFNKITTRNKTYVLSFDNIEEWKEHLKKFLYIRISGL